MQSRICVRAGKVDERSEQRLGCALNVYGGLHAHHVLQRQVLMAAVEYARK